MKLEGLTVVPLKRLKNEVMFGGVECGAMKVVGEREVEEQAGWDYWNYQNYSTGLDAGPG